MAAESLRHKVMLQSLGDPLQGYTTIDGRHFYVRQMKNLKASMPIGFLKGEPSDSGAGPAERCLLALMPAPVISLRSPATSVSPMLSRTHWLTFPKATATRLNAIMRHWLRLCGRGELSLFGNENQYWYALVGGLRWPDGPEVDVR